jgi:rhamnopyranosyl-N-acetylglucosaminyl-diphospho-decaprenol beta-1,3/1,4-galactofuranosyltransferase
MNESIAAVVVTYNRKDLLLECLAGLLKQTHMLDMIIVIDQASTDGTENILAEHGLLSEPRITYVRSSENTGGAGGFRAGMEVAYREGFAWIWLMDDDTEADSQALSSMLNYTSYPEVIAIANNQVYPDRTPLDSNTKPMVLLADESRPYKRLEFASFVGLLVSRSAIEKVGLPKAEFFIHCDDTEYCLRLIQDGNIAYAEDSVMVHKVARKSAAIIRIWKIYFAVAPIHEFCFMFFDMRNWTWTLTNSPFVRRRYLRLAAFYAKKLLENGLLRHDNFWLRMRIISKAFWDGTHNRFDNSFAFKMQAIVNGNSKNVGVGEKSRN